MQKLRKTNSLNFHLGVFGVIKNFLSPLLILSILTSVNFAQTAKATQAAATKTAPKQTTEVPFVNRVLPNGLEVIVLPDASVPIVTVELAVRNGSFTEPPELNGLSHLYEHMFFKPNQANLIFQCEMALNAGGLNDYGRRVCAEPLKLKSQIGNVAYLNNADQLSVYNGTTREEVVNYYYTTTSPYLSSAIRLINDAVRYPTFDEQELKEEIQVVIGEIDRNESNPFFYLNRTVMDKLFYK
jgi:zinc protease